MSNGRVGWDYLERFFLMMMADQSETNTLPSHTLTAIKRKVDEMGGTRRRKEKKNGIVVHTQ